jgi:hypothetical protein
MDVDAQKFEDLANLLAQKRGQLSKLVGELMDLEGEMRNVAMKLAFRMMTRPNDTNSEG